MISSKNAFEYVSSNPVDKAKANLSVDFNGR
jgi:hypothetical protein